MKSMEQLELDAYRNEIDADISSLFEKYRGIFGLDIPELDQAAADKLILAAMHRSLDYLAAQAAGQT